MQTRRKATKHEAIPEADRRKTRHLDCQSSERFGKSQQKNGKRGNIRKG